MKQFTNKEKAKMLQKIDELDINVTMYRKATNVLELNLENEDAIDGFIDDPTSPVNYDFIEDQYEDADRYYWVIDLQNNSPELTANNKEQLWVQIDKAIKTKSADSFYKAIETKMKTKQNQHKIAIHVLKASWNTIVPAFIFWLLKK